MTSIPEASGKRCKAYREFRRLSQEMVSERAEVDVSIVRRLEAGIVISRNSVEAIARALEITPATLFEKEDLEAFLASQLQDPDELADASEGSSGVDQLRHLDLETFERFKLLPGRFAGHRFQVAFDNDGTWRRVDTNVVLSFSGAAPEPGCCVRSSSTDIFDEQSQRIGCPDLYADGDTAIGLLELKKSTRVVAVAKMLFGFTLDPYSSGGFHDPKVYDEHLGLLIEEFTVVEDSGYR